MVKHSTLFHWVDGFDSLSLPVEYPNIPEENLEDNFISELLEPLIFDPGEELVQKILLKV